MNRQDFRKLAFIRLKESKVLLDKRKYWGAYYLCGYALECGLKACISKKIKRSQFPDLKFVKESWVHDLNQLVKQAALSDDRTNYLRPTGV
jgi:HEPN domain-containing protein